MTDEDLETFTKLMEQAKTDEERSRIRSQWLPHLSRCLVSTNRHVKAVEDALCSVTEGIKNLGEKMDRLHSVPKFKEDKIGWLKANWMWCVIMLYILQSLFGVNVAGMIQKLIS